MSERTPDRIWSGIEITKVIAGTLAAVTAAVIGSFLGVAGTLAGAAVASVVGSVGTELYQRSLHRGAKRLSTIAPTFVKVPAAVGTPPVAAAAEEESPSHTVVPGRSLRWGHVAIAATALFVLAIGSLTVFELIAGKSVASAVGNASTGRSTVSSVFGDDSARKPAVTPSPDSTPAPSGEPTEPSGGQTEPSGAPTTAPTTEPATEPTTEPAGEPTTGAPEQTPPPDTQDQEQPNQDVAPDQGTTK
ncbi:hypothetical protein GCM10020358_83430 [Amorphoplanes nipponensis]|uniref:Uncharacterized protein n=1 Tax=Actinoplanes nipponensis TaxID=135950 RepID=A0A919JET9_9ACTN|nr:hypothetical protein [Actinoplanes nipponensis]GIE47881.1 hypothetical protein Ani05nite_14150 [Actinoplanes nipponensis]